MCKHHNHRTDFFDRMADQWDSFAKHCPNKLMYLFNKANLKQGNRVLDVGTGTGVLIPYIVSEIGETGEVDAVDLSNKMLEKAIEKYPYKNVNYIWGDINDIYMMYQYDAIFCYCVFPHFADKFKTLKQLADGLNVGGKIIIYHPQSKEKINSVHKRVGVEEDVLPPAKEVANMMRLAGLHVSDSKIKDNSSMYYVEGMRLS